MVLNDIIHTLLSNNIIQRESDNIITLFKHNKALSNSSKIMLYPIKKPDQVLIYHSDPNLKVIDT